MRTREHDQQPSAIQHAPTPPPKGLMGIGNIIVRLLLRSPLHFLLSDNLLLLTYQGGTSGRQYTIPVTYSRRGDVVTVFTYRNWWWNLRGGAPVLVEIKRRRLSGWAEAIRDDQAAIAEGLRAHLWQHPSLASGYHVALRPDGQPDPDSVRQAARFEVIVRIRLTPVQENGLTEQPRATTQGAAV
jgi:hypothetical protein